MIADPVALTVTIAILTGLAFWIIVALLGYALENYLGFGLAYLVRAFGFGL